MLTSSAAKWASLKVALTESLWASKKVIERAEKSVVKLVNRTDEMRADEMERAWAGETGF